MKENLEIIRAACVKANPSIMELGFGCEIAIPELGVCVVTQEMRLDNFQLIPVSKELLPMAQGNVFIHYFSRESLSTHPILGRPVRLADVMFAIDKKIGVSDQIYSVNVYGEIEVRNRMTGIIQEVAFWTLSKDDLRDQSEETIAFLASLLSENK